MDQSECASKSFIIWTLPIDCAVTVIVYPLFFEKNVAHGQILRLYTTELSVLSFLNVSGDANSTPAER